MKFIDEELYYRIGEASALLLVSTSTLKRWTEKGVIIRGKKIEPTSSLIQLSCKKSITGYRYFKKSIIDSVVKQLYQNINTKN